MTVNIVAFVYGNSMHDLFPENSKGEKKMLRLFGLEPGDFHDTFDIIVSQICVSIAAGALMAADPVGWISNRK